MTSRNTRLEMPLKQIIWNWTRVLICLVPLIALLIWLAEPFTGGPDEPYKMVVGFLFVVVLLVVVVGVFCRGLAFQSEARSYVTLEEAATSMGTTSEELQAILDSRGVRPAIEIDGVQKFNPSDISGLRTLLRPASSNDEGTLLRSVGSSTSSNDLLRASDEEEFHDRNSRAGR